MPPSPAVSAAPLRLKLFGGPRVVKHGEEVSVTPLQRALLGLVHGSDDAPSRARVAWLLWEADDDAPARHRLSQLLYELKKRLGFEALLAEADTLGPDTRGAVVSDLIDMRRYLEKGPVSRALDILERGFLPEAEVTGAYADWKAARGIALRDELREAAARRWRESVDACAWESARDAAETLLRLDPLNEQFLRAVLRARAMAGSVEEAEAALEGFRERADREGLDWNEAGARDVLEDLRQATTVLRLARGSEPLLPLVGRERELKEVRSFLADGGDQPARYIVMEGEAGVGKTRLLQEVMRTLRADGVQVLRSGCAEFESRIPLNPILDALRRQGTSGHLAALENPWKSVAAQLLPELRSGGESPPPPIAPGSLARRTFESLRYLLEEVSGSRPMALCIDDMQWSDISSFAALQFITRRWEGAPLVVVMTVRSEAIRHGTEIADFLYDLEKPLWQIVPGLEDTAARELVRLAGGGELDEAAEGKLIGLGGSNPLFLIELTHEVLQGREVTFDLIGRRISIPAAVAAIVRRRMKDLTAELTSVVQLLAVGKRLTPRALRQILEMPAAAMTASLEQLSRLRLISFDESHAVIRHELLRRAVYDSVPRPVRTLLHELTAQWLEQHGDIDPGELATHFFLADRLDEALEYGLAGADMAEAAGAIPEAAELVRMCVECTRDEEQLRSLLQRQAALALLGGDFSAAEALYATLRAQLTNLGKERAALASELRRIRAAISLGPEARAAARRSLEEVLAKTRETNDWEFFSRAADLSLRLFDNEGDIGAAQARLRELRHVATEGSISAQCFANAALSLCHLFEPESGEEALRAAEQALALAAKSREPDSRSLAFTRYVLVNVHLGRLKDPAETRLTETRFKQELSAGDLELKYLLLSNLGVFHLDIGELPIARSLLAEAERVAKATTRDLEIRNILTNYGELYLSERRYEEALSCFRRAEQLLSLPSAEERMRRVIRAGIGLAGLLVGDLRTAREAEASLGPDPQVWHYDGYLIVRLRATLLRHRGFLAPAAEELAKYSEGVKGRLVPSWVKAKIQEARIRRKLDPMAAKAVAHEARDVAARLHLHPQTEALDDIIRPL